MKIKPQVCLDIENDLVAVATGDAQVGARGRVEDHIGLCAPCRGEFQRYREIEGVVGALRRAAGGAEATSEARERLESRLADLRSRLMMYRVFPSPLGNILIARSEHGVSLVEYLGERTGFKSSRLAQVAGVEAQEDGVEVEALYRELMEYLHGKRTRLEWPLDLRLARSDFQRAVMKATVAIPYGAVASYTGIATEVGNRSAVRAVAQALRWNPLPIVVPCHRVIGSSGALTGYAGDKLSLKSRLLGVEGVPTFTGRHNPHVARENMYVLNRGDVEYCLPTCGSLPTRTLADLTLFASRERAESVGLAPCTTCRPDLHPLAK
jgi:methylated-DNA-[protein]-cysteine S-methyltransferase